jgi:ATP synthase regulation protein NCA2
VLSAGCTTTFLTSRDTQKEMMNALHAMDEVMSSNDINMNLAAITPVALLGYVSVRVFRFFYYAFLKLGKSREQTYASIRNIVTDIERLLVMRNHPPVPNTREVGGWSPIQPCVLNSDDLGMLMLLIHELRSILLLDRRRFSEDMIRSVWEDLAELTGERGTCLVARNLFISDSVCLDVGAVSIQQQLSIINRMCRTYPFLKVVSTGHLFEFNPHWRP